MKTRFILPAARFSAVPSAFAAAALLFAAGSVAASGDDAISDDLDSAFDLLSGLPDLEGKSDEDVERMLGDNPDMERRVNEAGAKVTDAVNRISGGSDVQRARELLQRLPDLSGKTDAEIRQYVDKHPEVGEDIKEAARLLGRGGEDDDSENGGAGGNGSEGQGMGDRRPESGPEGGEGADEGFEAFVDGIATNILDDVYFGSLDWCWGGFKAENAEKGDVVITDLKMEADGLRFKYVKDLSEWGIMDPQDASEALACLFVLDSDGKWVGGKFDWISSSRETRDFKNVYGCYNGWNVATVPNPTMAAFVIVSKNGKRRSNVIVAVWER